MLTILAPWSTAQWIALPSWASSASIWPSSEKSPPLGLVTVPTSRMGRILASGDTPSAPAVPPGPWPWAAMSAAMAVPCPSTSRRPSLVPPLVRSRPGSTLPSRSACTETPESIRATVMPRPRAVFCAVTMSSAPRCRCPSRNGSAAAGVAICTSSAAAAAATAISRLSSIAHPSPADECGGRVFLPRSRVGAGSGGRRGRRQLDRLVEHDGDRPLVGPGHEGHDEHADGPGPPVAEGQGQRHPAVLDQVDGLGVHVPRPGLQADPPLVAGRDPPALDVIGGARRPEPQPEEPPEPAGVVARDGRLLEDEAGPRLRRAVGGGGRHRREQVDVVGLAERAEGPHRHRDLVRPDATGHRGHASQHTYMHVCCSTGPWPRPSRPAAPRPTGAPAPGPRWSRPRRGACPGTATPTSSWRRWPPRPATRGARSTTSSRGRRISPS